MRTTLPSPKARGFSLARMSVRPDIVVVYPSGGDRDDLLETLKDRARSCVDDPATIDLGPPGRMILAAPQMVVRLRNAIGRHIPLMALVAGVEETDAALSNGADDAVPWPGSRSLLRKRVASFLDGTFGPSRIVLDPRRVTSLVHAIRNPLNVITLYAELLKMENLSEDALGSVGRLVRAAKRVDALAGELETLLYLESGQAPVRTQPTELGELVEAVLAELSFDIEDKPLEVNVALAQKGTVAQADPDLARRALHAVFGRVTKLCLGNSAVDVKTAGDPPRVEILAPIDPVPPSKTAALHTPATELDARESLGGVGVGLSFAYRALDSMGGRLEHDVDPNGRAMTRLVFRA